MWLCFFIWCRTRNIQYTRNKQSEELLELVVVIVQGRFKESVCPLIFKICENQRPSYNTILQPHGAPVSLTGLPWITAK